MAVALRGPIRIADLTPELIDAIELPRDGERVMLQGYVNGRRCPSRVKAEYTAAIRGNPHPDGVFDYGVHLAQVRGCLAAVVRGLEDTEADMLAGDDEGGGAVLRLLGWWATADDDEDEPDPEVTAESPTLETSSRNSRRSTARKTG